MVVPVHKCAATGCIKPAIEIHFSEHGCLLTYNEVCPRLLSEFLSRGVPTHKCGLSQGVAWQWHVIAFAQLSLPSLVAQWLEHLLQ